YYTYGANSLLESDLAGLRLDEVTGQHAQQYAARLSASLKPSTINWGLRTLRRALALAEEWGKLDRAPKISLAKGERQREMVLAVYDTLAARHQAQGYPSGGWVFPSGSASGHFEQGSAKNQHARAVQLSGVKPFEPYCLRHTGLTDLAETGCDAFTFAKIAG